MRCLKRNKQTFYYMLYNGKAPLLDTEGYKIGYGISYSDATLCKAYISISTGETEVFPFGNNEEYDKIIITDDMNCPIDEQTVLFVDKEPEYDASGNPLFDYRVRRVAKSLNHIMYAISKVKVSDKG